MTDSRYQRRYIDNLRESLIADFGGSCSACHSTAQLEFAHTEPTGLSGTGRGSKNRYLDIHRNPDKYILLCHTCHYFYDHGGKHEIEVQTQQTY